MSVLSTSDQIKQYYRNILQRDPDAAGLSGWTAAVDSGAMTLSQVENAIVISPEAQADVVPVVDFYAALGRTPDQAGLSGYVAAMEQGASMVDIAADFLGSPEGQGVYGSGAGTSPDANLAFINTVYQLVLGRPPETAGMGWWADALAAGTTPAQMLTEVLQSTEAQAHCAPMVTDFLMAAGEGTADYGAAIQHPAPPPAFVLSASVDGNIAAQVDEGGTIMVRLDTTNFALGTTYQYTITGAGISAADFVGDALTGTFTVDSSGSAVVALTLAKDALTEGAETFTLALLNSQASVSILVNDTSVTPLVHVFTLTPVLNNGPDFVGGAEDDIFNAVGSALPILALPTWSPGDVIDGGAGTDTFNVAQTLAISNPAGSVVENIEIGNFSSGEKVTLDTRAWTGFVTLNTHSVNSAWLTAASDTDITATVADLTSDGIIIKGGNNVSVTATESTSGGAISIGTSRTAPLGEVTVANTFTNAFSGDGAQGNVVITGGTTVTVTETAANEDNTTATMGSVTVHGTATTTDVTVTQSAVQSKSEDQAGVVDNSVSVTDSNSDHSTGAGSITSVTVSNFTSLTIADDALATLDVSGGSGNITINDGNLTTATNQTLALTIDGQSGGNLSDSNVYTTINITTAGVDSTLSNIRDRAATALTVAGTNTLILECAAGMRALQTVTVSGAAGIIGDFTTTEHVTSIDTSDTTGNSTVTLQGESTSFNGGAGVDIVTETGVVAEAISLGDGDDSLTLENSGVPTAEISGGDGIDTLTMDSTLAATASGGEAFGDLVTGFERLELKGATNQTIDLAALGITEAVITSGGNGLTLANFQSGATLILDGAGTAYTLSNTAFASGEDDLVNLTLQSKGNSDTYFAATGITTDDVETIAITTEDGQDTPSGSFKDRVTLLGNSATTITVAGNAGLALTATDTAATTIDASGITLGGFTFTSGALSAAAAITGSTSGGNTVDFSAATEVVTYTGGSGNDRITGGGKDNVVSLGDGANTYTASSGDQTVTGGADDDTVFLGSGNNTVSLGDGSNSFTAGDGNNTYIGGADADVVTVGAGANSVTLGAGANVLNLNAANSTADFTTIMDPTAGDTISFLNKGTEVFDTTMVTDGISIQSLADAVVAAGGDASTNGKFGWFQLSGDTYLVESQHNGSVSATFHAGTDLIVKLTGLVDLSTATFNHTQSLVLT
jgi:S-layer protein